MSEQVEFQCFAQEHIDGIMLVNAQPLAIVGVKPFKYLTSKIMQFDDLFKAQSALRLSFFITSE